jgi:hypothetical protein
MALVAICTGSARPRQLLLANSQVHVTNGRLVTGFRQVTRLNSMLVTVRFPGLIPTVVADRLQ